MGRLKDVVERIRFEVERMDYADCVGYLFTMLYSAVGSPRCDISKSSVRIHDCFVSPLSRVLDQAGASRLLGKNLAMLLKRPSP